MSSQLETLQVLEKRLEQSLGAAGKTWAEKVSSLEKVLPAVLIKQLLALPQLSGETFTKSAESCQTQLALFARVTTQNPQEEIWSEAQRAEARAKQDVTLNRLGNTQKATVVMKLTWWLYDTRAAIPKKAYAMSRTWRFPMTMVFALIGGAAGWFSAGAGAAAFGVLILGTFGFILWSEHNLARSLWAQTRVLETLLALFRGAIVVFGIILGLGLLAVAAWLMARFWNAR
jgi:hypothetical protein